MNLPNKLTLLRVILIPVFIVLVTLPGFAPGYLLAGIVFSVASFTDFLDGHIARKHNLVTDFGKFADPLADKLLTTVAFIYMLVDGVCSPLVLVIILAREFAVSGVRMLAAGAKQSKVIAANLWGKVKTVMQMVTIIFYYLVVGVQHLIPFPAEVGYLPQVISSVLCWLVALVTLVSGIQYIWGNRQYLQEKA